MESFELNINTKPVLQRDKKTGRFIKGCEPWNKNIKITYPGCKKTQFKKGNLPQNTKNNKFITIRFHKRTKINYKYIKISNSNWILLHHFNWMKKYGNIPDKHIIRFNDEDTLNCDINNLECISMKENLLRNYNRKKHGETMKELWRQEKFRVKYGLEKETNLNVII